MRFRRLGWAGVELEAGGERLVIDYYHDPGLFEAFLASDAEPRVALEPGSVRAALLTHLHRDHTDVGSISSALASDGVVLRPTRARVQSELQKVSTGEAEAALKASPLNVTECAVGDSVELGPFRATAVFASDGLGSPQVSWIVEADGRRALHGGDTVWHGAWWEIAHEHGPIDVAFLPANGPAVDFPHLQPPVNVPAALTPEQAVEAAVALKAGLLVPIHCDEGFGHERFYRPQAGVLDRVTAAGSERGAAVAPLEPGVWSELPPAATEPPSAAPQPAAAP